jgi:hypothetical protein
VSEPAEEEAVSVPTSILTCIKKLLGIDSTYTDFDTDIIIFINSAIMALNQLGVGPTLGYVVTGDTEDWADLVEDEVALEAVKTFIYLKVRLVFDPPTSGTVLQALTETLRETEWRITARNEELHPTPDPVEEDEDDE